jgi:hypothetical protein
MRISESTRRSLTVAGANDSWIEFRTRHGLSQANAFTATETASALKGTTSAVPQQLQLLIGLSR